MSSIESVPLSNLFAAVEDLLKRVADSDDPDILRMRAKLRADMIELKNPTSTPARVSKNPSDDLDRPKGRYPALAVLTGAAVALTLFRSH